MGFLFYLVKLDVNPKTVWLTQTEMVKLFEVDRTSAKKAHMGNSNLQRYNVKYYNCFTIINVI